MVHVIWNAFENIYLSTNSRETHIWCWFLFFLFMKQHFMFVTLWLIYCFLLVAYKCINLYFSYFVEHFYVFIPWEKLKCFYIHFSCLYPFYRFQQPNWKDVYFFYILFFSLILCFSVLLLCLAGQTIKTKAQISLSFFFVVVQIFIKCFNYVSTLSVPLPFIIMNFSI